MSRGLSAARRKPWSPSGGLHDQANDKESEGAAHERNPCVGRPAQPLAVTVEVIEDAEGRPEKRIKIMGPDPQEAIKGYIGFWRKWACIIIKYEGGDPARYYEILSGRKNPKPSDEDVNLRLVPVPATGRYKLKRDGAAKGRGTSDSSEVEIPVELDSKYAAAKLLCHLDDVEKCLRSSPDRRRAKPHSLEGYSSSLIDRDLCASANHR